MDVIEAIETVTDMLQASEPMTRKQCTALFMVHPPVQVPTDATVAQVAVQVGIVDSISDVRKNRVAVRMNNTVVQNGHKAGIDWIDGEVPWAHIRTGKHLQNVVVLIEDKHDL